ncbi:MAG: dTDP-4-dehydrorhamnose 3,5-epimerase [Candidatus Marinimicrobia bacterium]|jgi:dTDP-4-dehydrorhamnose 3,5-epimerase|nr:dTDP-4-dehydrorhamnose 3,5-epimerase [Candidatus Neomarinimicrobiota bacterium]MBT3496370.1 dTDP-4-dehydrorhamnose 3,5-epimerase [Candidatus Neomarinimicrobiota bacterium]MBT3692581.1 dTDP-4-dehydrorhamnose 3,5-epimerase [Candidatus Neomarinimicrobiota bacterium]MBT3732000.1 dTDP-4-dehydrorhamnose 3,5-epimerase [Candidatus Neomarinimicrobiota bacterium]MBT4145219.1 dTDP-4-dehydrorhamnose 3,5-epimerase [Candidatus Neomarinimicrobiota bacterium]
MIVEAQSIADVLVIKPIVHQDNRGYFLESFRQDLFKQYDLDLTFAQDNEAFSEKNVLRGLHYQLKHPQGKLIRCIQGEILDVAVDIRRGSDTFGKYVSYRLSSDKKEMMFVPEGFAHGYSVLSDTAIIQYKCTDYYHPEDEHGIKWNDTSLAIDWHILDAIISEKDTSLPLLDEVNPDYLPKIGD